MNCFDTEPMETLLYYGLFAAGDESDLTWIVGRVHKQLVLAGKQLLSDEFVVKTIVQESILKS